MDLSKLIARVKAMALSPRTEWPVIEAEQTTTADLFKNYIVVLAAIPAVFTFLKATLIGISIPFVGTVRIGFLAGLTDMILGYGVALAVVFLTAWIVDALAPKFGGQKDHTQALKTVVYVSIVNWIAGVAMILPGFGTPVLLVVGLYSVYLLYLGLPVTMKCPREKAGVYAVATLVSAFLISIVGTFASTRVSGAGSMLATSDGAGLKLDESSPLGMLEQQRQDLEAARQEAGTIRGDGWISTPGTATKDTGPKPIDPERLRAFLPQSLQGNQRTYMGDRHLTGRKGKISSAAAEYSDASSLYIFDYGSAENLRAELKWSDVENDVRRDSQQKIDNSDVTTSSVDGRPVRELWAAAENRGRLDIVVGNRFKVTLNTGRNPEPPALRTMDALKNALAQIDLDGIEALK